MVTGGGGLADTILDYCLLYPPIPLHGGGEDSFSCKTKLYFCVSPRDFINKIEVA